MLRRPVPLLVAVLCALLLTSCGATTYVDSEVGGTQPAGAGGWQRIEPITLELPDADPFSAPGTQQGIVAKPGAPTLVNIWASFCEPCKDELPLLQAVAEAGDLVVVGYTRDRRTADARAALGAAGVTYLNYLDPDARVALALDGRVPINGIPSSVLVRGGKAIAVHIGPFPDRATILAALEIR